MNEEMRGKTFFNMLNIIFFQNKLRLSDINNKKYARLLKGMCEQYLLDENVSSKDSKLTDYYKVWMRDVNENIANIFIDVDDYELKNDVEVIIFIYFF